MSKIILLLYALTTSVGLVILKLGAKAGAPIHYLDNKLQFNVNFYTVIGFALYGISFFLYIYLISKFDLGYIIPLATALVYILIFFASFIVFKESFTTIKILGIILILGGVLLLNAHK
ncbi:MAG: hypothetical protein WC498_03930 [Candidatus Saccharimonadales bacterium]